MREMEVSEGLVDASELCISMKMADPLPPSPTLHPVNVTPSIESAALPEREREMAPPSLDAPQRVKVVDPLMERDAVDVSVADTAAPLPSSNDRSVKVHESIVADAPDWMERAEVEREMGVLGVDEEKVMLVRERIPALASTSEHGAVSVKSIHDIVTGSVEAASMLITNRAVHPETVSAPTDFEGIDSRVFSRVMENGADVMVVVLISIDSCSPSSSSIEVTQSVLSVNA